MPITLLRFVSILWLLPILVPTAAAEPATLAGGDNFGIQLVSSGQIAAAPAAGAFRILAGPHWISGGGVRAVPSIDNLEAAELLDTGYRLKLENGDWLEDSAPLPEPVAWAAVEATAAGELIVVGGLRAEGISSRVSKWREVDGTWSAGELPPLPRALLWSGACIMDNVLYVAGGTGPEGHNARLLALDLTSPTATWSAQQLHDIGLPLLQPALETRKDEVAIRNALYLFGGWTLDPGEAAGWRAVSSGLKLLPSGAAGMAVTPMEPSPADRLITAASPLGPSHILAGSVAAGDLANLPAFIPLAAFPNTGFLRYHVFTDTWARFSAPMTGAVTAIEWTSKKEILFSMADGAGAEQIHQAEIVAAERHFSFLDYLVMVLYMFGLVAIGKYFASRERNTEDFFLGGRRVPWWAAGLSIYATGTSAISFMAIPAKTYSTDWLYFIGMSIFPFFTVLIAAYVFIPLLRRLEITTVMEYFELRFGRPVRLLMSAVAVLGQVAGRMSITLLLPSIALTAVTGMNIYLCILLMGVLATIYTAVGGINAVIWTDVLQVFVLFGGAILSFLLIVFHVDGGVGSVFTLAVEDNKFHLIDGSWNFTTATIWIMLLWAVSDVFGKGLGQEGLQRAFSTKGVKEARRSMITCAVVALPAGFLFYGIGTALYSFYHANPELLNPTLQTDAIFPLFIAQQLPAGIAGLVISGLFAASMSTLDTAMNTSATILVRDFYSIWRKNAPDHQRLVMAKVITIICGVLGTGIALYMASFDNLGSLWDMFSILLGVIGGGLGGVGVLALCTTRANTWGTLAGAAVTAVCIVLIKQYTPVHFFIYGTISMAIGGTTGYLFSLLIPSEPKDLTGLTLWTPAPRQE